MIDLGNLSEGCEFATWKYAIMQCKGDVEALKKDIVLGLDFVLGSKRADRAVEAKEGIALLVKIVDIQTEAEFVRTHPREQGISNERQTARRLASTVTAFGLFMDAPLRRYLAFEEYKGIVEYVVRIGTHGMKWAETKADCLVHWEHICKLAYTVDIKSLDDSRMEPIVNTVRKLFDRAPERGSRQEPLAADLATLGKKLVETCGVANTLCRDKLAKLVATAMVRQAAELGKLAELYAALDPLAKQMNKLR